MAALRESKMQDSVRYTYADYCNWDDDKRWELIDGVPYAMAAPSYAHQSVSGNLYLQVGQFLRGKKCKVLYAPFDVRLNTDTLDNTVVQPDILVVCDESKFDKAGLVGAPDVVVEILSPTSSSHDMIRKYNLYMKAGVREYWIVDPELQTVVTNILENGQYVRKDYEKPEVVPISVLEGCTVDLAEVFME